MPAYSARTLVPEIKLFELFGVPVYLNLSFAFIILLLASDLGDAVLGVACALALAASVLLHEFGHIWAASAFGVRASRVTLSLIGGCASLNEIPRSPKGEFLTAVAGPGVSFAIALCSWAALRFFPYDLVPAPELFAMVFFYTTLMNTMLGAFNLLPGFPMDGGRVFRSILARFTTRARATWYAMAVGRATAIGILLWGFYRYFTIKGYGFPYITVFIVLMIWREGWREYMIARLEEQRGGGVWAEYISPPPYGR